MPIEQSGNITTGHSAIWAAQNVLKDGGPIPSAQRVLASAQGVDFNTTADYALVLPAAILAFQLTGITVTNPSVSLTTAVGGFYPAASKGGTPIVSAAQVYSTLTVPSKLLACTLASYGATTRFDRNILTAWEIFFALTTPQGSVATADIFLIGIDLTVSP